MIGLGIIAALGFILAELREIVSILQTGESCCLVLDVAGCDRNSSRSEKELYHGYAE